MKQAFPRHQEPPELIARLAGLLPNGQPLPSNQQLQGGMSAGEALVFWLGGFSADPRYPISGEGGPSYPIQALGDPDNATLDPIENRPWVFPFDVGRLKPRLDDVGYFDQDVGRYIEYTVQIKGVPQLRRINFWQYWPRNSEEPYLYFDTSRHQASEFDPPANADVHVHALKKIENPGSPNEKAVFIESEKFQILHCGIDEAWGEDFDRTSYEQYVNNRDQFLNFPEGPFTGEIADTIVNFTTETKLEDAQP
jgi:hypothetical protein